MALLQNKVVTERRFFVYFRKTLKVLLRSHFPNLPFFSTFSPLHRVNFLYLTSLFSCI